MGPVERGRLDFASVYTEHAAFVRRTLARRGVRSEDLDDVLQETFVTVHRLLPSFEGRASLETWLCSVSWRVASSYHRRVRGQREVVSGEPGDGFADDVKLTAPRAPSGVHASLARIEEANRDVLALHDIGGLSISEVSELTGNARATIRNRLDRARLALGRRMWSALTEHEDAAWLERLSPQLAKRVASTSLPLVRGIVVSGETAISVVDDLGIVVWRGEPTVEAMATVIQMLIPFADSSPKGLRYLSVVEPTSTPPGREARQMMAWGAGRLGPRIRAAGWAVENAAMTAIVAPVVNACFFLGGVPINMRFFDGVRPAATWLTQYGSLEPSEIAAHIDAMKSRLSNTVPPLTQSGALGLG